ncbi:SIMPL domain-containing protein [Streptosporangium fragile]|uniref:SIMPL domain-containing protein n=1 Tax=Streptosporangium fragile TaxID=46186 RepID=A0ABP6IYF5_9ACTN
MAAAVLVSMGLFAGPAFADSGTAKVMVEDDRPQITVVGEGSVSLKPDVMRLNAGVEVRRATAGEAFGAARTAAAALTQALLQAGVPAEDLRTSELSLGPEYENYPKISGYRAAQGVEAVIRDVEAADDIVDAVAAVGEDVRLNGVTFEVSDPRGALEAAREAAFKDAKARARQYARLAGRQLGPVVNIGEESASLPRPMMAGAAMADKASISPGRQAVSVSVRVVFALT